MAKRITFSKHDLNLYFDRICMPKSRRIYDVSTLGDTEKLSFLNLLQKHQLVKMPWENLSQHYSWHGVVNLQPAHLFKKMVNNPGRGGYCMEVNFFYHLVLFTLGFNVYMAGSRIYSAESKSFGGWTHVVNLVTIAGKKYLLDGGFGGQGPARPVPLDHGVVSDQVSPAQMRLMFEPIPDNRDQSQKVWVFQHRYDDGGQWTPMYCFVELEFTPSDVQSMNYAPWLSRYTFFTHKVVSVRFTTNRESDDSSTGPGSPDEDALEGDIDGSITINHDNLKWRRNGKKVVAIPFKTDQDRVDALQKYYGITLADEDREAIIGTMAMIGVKAMGADN